MLYLLKMIKKIIYYYSTDLHKYRTYYVCPSSDLIYLPDAINALTSSSRSNHLPCLVPRESIKFIESFSRILFLKL